MTKNIFKFGDISIEPGRVKKIKLKVTEIYMSTAIHIPIIVVNGVARGPVVTVMSCIHGDELNGIEIIRQIKTQIDPRQLEGTLILVLIANPMSFILQQRDLPDGKDLNRAFPGSPKGSLSSILAHKIYQNFVVPADYILDLHTAGHGRLNVPYTRVNLRNKKSRSLAFLFGPEFIFDSVPSSGMLRRSAEKIGKGVLTFEAGEPMKLHPDAISYGLKKIKNVITGLNMYKFQRHSPAFQFIMGEHKWLKAKKGGILVIEKKPGEVVKKGEVIGFTENLFQEKTTDIRASYDGIIIGITTKPHALAGEGVCHLFGLDEHKKRSIQRFLVNNIVRL
ncbi:MAG: succinylglutamate desuccinylase/aspartoacylase family protein [Planctomycetes bacterium]|nr:succinylglutamate desuccinylase/aspartoacylase family protein [Planctomycetota bacterium]